jgi:hypothetical protein
MQVTFAVVLVALLGVLALLHVYWALGGRGAIEATVPSANGRPLFEPGPLACVAVAVALTAAAAICGARAALWAVSMPVWVSHVGIWVIALLFAARAIGEFRYVGFFKRVRGSVFARRDSLFYSPLCVLIALLAAGLALSQP